VKTEDHVSEEQLNAFVDGELEPEERSKVFSKAEHSLELDQRLCRQRKLKELVQHAYRDVPRPPRLRGGSPRSGGRFRMAAAAAVLLFFGAGAGIAVRDHLAAGGGMFPAGDRVAQDDFLLHVTSGEPADMKRALDKAAELLAAASPDHPRRVEVVANEKGLNLLRSDVTPFSREISELSEESVVFYACSRAIQILEDKGVEVRLVPEAIPDYTALDRVVKRMREGWRYIKI